MSEIEQEAVDAVQAEPESEVTEDVTPDEELAETTDWKAEAEKARGIAKRALTKLKKIGEKKVVAEAATKPVKEVAPKTGGLDENALDFLDLKGISEAEDIAIIETVIARTGQTVRQALKDDYVIAKLEANKANREVKAATPSSTRRGGSQSGTDIATAIAKFEQTGELPTDFATRSAVVNALEAKTSGGTPSWRR